MSVEKLSREFSPLSHANFTLKRLPFYKSDTHYFWSNVLHAWKLLSERKRVKTIVGEEVNGRRRKQGHGFSTFPMTINIHLLNFPPFLLPFRKALRIQIFMTFRSLNSRVSRKSSKVREVRLELCGRREKNKYFTTRGSGGGEVKKHKAWLSRICI